MADPHPGRFRKGTSGNPKGRPRKDRAPEIPQAAVPDMAIVPGLSYERLDGWMSTLTGIGDPAQDKRLSHFFAPACLSYQQAINLWRSDDIARRAIEAPIKEAFRQGYEITISDEGKYDDLKEKVEDKISELKLNDCLERAMCMERALGGAAILIGYDDGQALDQPLDLTKVKDIDWLTVLEPIELAPYKYYSNPKNAKYGEPEIYQLNTFTVIGALAGAGGAGISPDRAPSPDQQFIHESRLIVFPGIRVSRYQVHGNVAGALWGDSRLTALVEILRDFNVAWHAAGLIAVDFGQPVISIQNLMTLVMNNPAKLIARMRAFEQSRSTARAILIDTNEKFERQSTNLTGLPDLLNALSMRLSAAIDQPLTLLMGQSPKGIGNEGDSDVRFYYDRIRGLQMTKIGPLLRSLIKVIMQTIRKKKLPKKWGIAFHQLWQMTDAEIAEARLNQARSDSMYVKMGAVSSNEIRRSRFVGGWSWETQVDENKQAPGFAALPPPGTPGSPQNPGGAPTPPGSHAVTSYTRKNPAAPAGGQAQAAQGGDVAPQGEKRDAAETAAWRTELEYQLSMLTRARVRGDSPATIALIEALVEIAQYEQDLHEEGDCLGPGDCEHCDAPKPPPPAESPAAA